MDTSPYINDFAQRSFRDPADQDYIAARTCHRMELDQQFLWSGLQAIEKYLKAILLYNRRSAKRLSHDLVRALSRIESIADLTFTLPNDVISFIEYLDRYGTNRYLVHPMHLTDTALFQLDRAVWYVRRYAYYMRGEINRTDGSVVNRLELQLEYVHSPMFEAQPHRYRVFGGFLENAIDKKTPAASALTWKNVYYGRRGKRRLRNVRLRGSSINPTHYLHPEVFSELDCLVDFPKQVREAFRELTSR